jgi:hypothetical protein
MNAGYGRKHGQEVQPEAVTIPGRSLPSMVGCFTFERRV